MKFQSLTLGYVQTVMEFEAGWGAKPDGMVVAVSPDDLATADKMIREKNSDSFGMYLQGEIRAVNLSEEGLAKIEKIFKARPDRPYVFIDQVSEIGELVG